MKKNNTAKSSQQYLLDLYENSPIAYQSLDSSGYFLDVNKKWLEILGYRKNEVIGKKLEDFIHEDSRILFYKYFKEFSRKGEIKSKIIKIVDKKGKILMVSFDGILLYDQELKVKKTHCIMMDITDDQKNKEELFKAKEKFRILTEASIEAIVVIQDMEIKYFNKKFLNLSFYNEKEKSVYKLASSIYPDDKDRFIEIYKRRESGFKEDVIFDFRVITKNKGIFWLSIKSGYIEWEGKPASINVFSDISEKKKNEESLKRILKMNKDILDNSPVGIFVINKKGGVVYVNSKMIDISGTAYNEFTKVNFLNHQGYKKIGLLPKIINCFKGEKFELKEVEYTSSIGNKTTIRNFIGIPIEEDGYLNVLIIVEDISQLKKRENDFKEAMEQWSTTFDSLTSGILILDKNNHILDSNQGFLNIFALKKDKIFGKNYLEVFKDHNFLGMYNQAGKMQKSNDKEVKIEYFNEKIKKWLLLSILPILDRKGEVNKILYLVDDITDQKKKEGDLTQKNDEMAIFNRIAVDREIRMIELKEEINRLKENIKNN